METLPRILILTGILFMGCLTGCTNRSGSAQSTERIAPLLEGMGGFHYPVNTNDTLAQAYFDQGLVLSYGFNHRESHRSFAQAALLDSNLAMAYWGQALVLGPNINAAMNPDDAPEAWRKTQQAVKKAGTASPQAQALIEALTYRYTKNPPEDRSSLDSAYAFAMGKVDQEFPADMDIQTLYAEALMDLHPWNYWKENGEPQPWTPEILQTLERVIEHAPEHPGANHLYIHATEASDTPEMGLPSAHRLKDLIPGAGHLVHMPSHVYIRTGDYHAGTLANERAVQADNEYVTQCRQQGIYPLAYVPHNYHFLWATATMEGRQERSIKAARRTSALVDTTTMREPGMGTLQHYWVIPLYSLVRFGQWNKIINYPKPAEDLRYPLGVWHYARGMALTARGQLIEAAEELSEVEEITQDERLMEVTIWDINTTQELMQIASLVLKGEMAAAQKNYGEAIAALRQAVKIEDRLNYNEPPDWFFPVRHSLGAVLLEAGEAEKAEQVYRKDLEKFPENGWSLYGLSRSLKAQGKKKEAAQVKKKFNDAWQYADIELSSSRIIEN